MGFVALWATKSTQHLLFEWVATPPIFPKTEKIPAFGGRTQNIQGIDKGRDYRYDISSVNTTRRWIILVAALAGAACLGLALAGLAGGAWFELRRPATAPVAGGSSGAPEGAPAGGLRPSPALSASPSPHRDRPVSSTPASRPTGEVPGQRPAEGKPPLAPQPGGGGPGSSPQPPRAGTPVRSTPTRIAPAGPTAGPAGQPITGTLNTLDNPWCLPPNSPVTQAQVTDIIDGITIEVAAAGQTYPVRYIGLRLLDYSQDAAVWTRATEKNRALVQGKTVLLYRDLVDQDDEGNRLRYVLTDGRLINYELAAAGFANAESQPPNTRCDALLLQAETKALAGGLGLWQPTPTATRTLIPLPSPTIAATGEMVITIISKRGTIWQEPEEFVEIRNDAPGPIDLQNWSLQDDQRHVFIFPHFTLGPGQYCRVYTNLYRPASCGFSYDSPSPIWDNDAECAYLKDPLGRLVSTFCYGGP